MSAVAQPARPDRTALAVTLLTALGIGLVLVRDVSPRQALLFLIATGLGVTLLHASFGFTGAWRHFIRERRAEGIHAQLLLFALTSVVFFPLLGDALPGLVLNPALAPAGLSVVVGAFLFGIGMQLGGGCGSGTLYTVGGGHVRMLITLAFFVVGTVLATAHLHWWVALPSLGRRSLIEALGWGPALAVQLAVLGALFALVRRARRGAAGPPARAPAGTLAERLIYGPWPLWWGALGLAVLSVLTLVVAGHPWSITFAFGLWGAKIWTALGGDVSGWPYWSSGYPAMALGRSVLSDATSVMDFGVILGAALAASLAGRFAPDTRLRPKGVATAVVGGLLLGYGARLAFGCNIGSMFAGISSGSLHGWLWLIAGFAGAVVGVRLRALIGLDPPVGGRP